MSMTPVVAVTTLCLSASRRCRAAPGDVHARRVSTEPTVAPFRKVHNPRHSQFPPARIGGLWTRSLVELYQ